MEHLRPRGFTELVDAAFRLLRARFAALATGAALVMIPATAVGLANSYILTSRAATALAAGNAVVPRATVWPLLIAGLFVSFVGFVFGFAAMVHVAARAYLNEPAELGEGLARARQRFRLLLLTALAKYGMTFTCGVVATLVATAMVAYVHQLEYVLIAVLLVVMTFLLVRWSMTGAVIVLEEPRFVGEALARSVALTKANRLRLTGVFGIVLAIAYSSSLAISLFGMRIVPSLALVQLMNSFVWFVAYPLLAVLVTVAYYDLRIRHEGLDLELMARGLVAAPTPEPAPASVTSPLSA